MVGFEILNFVRVLISLFDSNLINCIGIALLCQKSGSFSAICYWSPTVDPALAGFYANVSLTFLTCVHVYSGLWLIRQHLFLANVSDKSGVG